MHLANSSNQPSKATPTLKLLACYYRRSYEMPQQPKDCAWKTVILSLASSSPHIRTC